MAFTPLWTTGWEHGAFSTAGGGIAFSSSGAVSVQATTVRSGAYALKCSPTATVPAWMFRLISSTAVPLARVYVRLSAVPTTDFAVFPFGNGHFAGIGIRGATGKFAPFVKAAGDAIVWGTEGAAVTAGEWTRIDVEVLTESGPAPNLTTINWYIEGLAQPQSVLNSNVTVGWNRVYCGNPVANTEALDVFYDDLVVYGEPHNPGLPVGAGFVVGLTPNRQGTHSNASQFTDDAGNTPPVNPHLRVDEIPATSTADFFKQTAIDAAAYIELGLLPTAESEFHGLEKFGAFVSSASANIHLTVVDGANQEDHSFFGSNGTNLWYESRSNGTRAGPTDPAWTTADVNALLLRVGKSSDVTPNPECHQVMLEVAVREAAAAGWGIVIPA